MMQVQIPLQAETIINVCTALGGTPTFLKAYISGGYSNQTSDAFVLSKFAQLRLGEETEIVVTQLIEAEIKKPSLENLLLLLANYKMNSSGKIMPNIFFKEAIFKMSDYVSISVDQHNVTIFYVKGYITSAVEFIDLIKTEWKVDVSVKAI
jgi:hypothetical protein